jgi:mannose-1-phosphate guanylyltransferase
MPNRGETWAVVLAGGSGTRLSSLTTDEEGVVIPKQFCSLDGRRSLLQVAIEQTENHVPRERIMVVVAADHQRWWEPQVAALKEENVVVQPCGRGTACGVLLPLMHINRRNPEATIIVTPSDQHLDDQKPFHLSLMEALTYVRDRPRLLLLLGMEPDSPVTDYGWITPATDCDEAVQMVTSFVEKPDERAAQNLLLNGALWSSFTFVTSVGVLMSRFHLTVPWLIDRFEHAFEYGSWKKRNEFLPGLYEEIPAVDFSRSILQKSNEEVHVLAVPPCGWTDLGTPERVAACVGKAGPCSITEEECQLPGRPPLDLGHTVGIVERSNRGSHVLARTETLETSTPGTALQP